MKRPHRLAAGMFCLVFLVCVFTSAALAENKMRTMTGKISFVNRADNVVVIDVPMGDQMFTVAGPLHAGAILTRKARSADLEEFKAGETATVKFHTTSNGHVIDALSVR